MPENLAHQPTPADQPPDPAAARAAAREARRIMVISRWPQCLLAAAGTVPLLILCVLGQQPGYWPWVRAAAAVWALTITGLWIVLSRKRRALLGQLAGTAFGRDELKASGITGLDVLTVVLVIAAALAGWGLRRAGMIEFRTFVQLVGGAVMFTGTAYGLLLTLRTRLWEMAYTGTLCAALALAIVAIPLKMLQSNIWLVPSWGMAIFVPVALSFWNRWRRWVKSLPPEGADAGVQEASHA